MGKADKKQKKEEEPEAETPEKKAKKVKKEKKDTTEKKNKKRKADEPAEVEAEAPVSEKKAKKAKKEDKKEKKSKKAKKAEEPAAEEEEAEEEAEEEEVEMKVHKKDTSSSAANPTGTCEVFMGNLSFSIDDASIKQAFAEAGEIVATKWLEHRDTGKFKGAGFITFSTPEGAANAVAMNGQDVMGRPIKVDFSNGKPAGAKGGKPGKNEVRPMQPKPDGCNTLFCGNLSFDVNDDLMREFFSDCGEINQIRWLTDRETGDFRGCGFVEFADPDSSLDKAAKKNGADFLGRTIRLDYAAPRAR